VQQSGGHIWVYSEPGRGSTFKVYLPNAEAKLVPATERAAEIPVVRRDGTTILLVEDDEIMLSLTRQLLVENGYFVLDAKNGETALEVLGSHPGPVHLVLTDVVMRGMSGPELVAQVLTSHPGVKIVFMSGYTGELIAQHGHRRNDIPLLEKPFSRVALLKVLDEALG